jgi:predicted SAM-dependent methyltransferase
MGRELDLGAGAVVRAPGAIRADISRDVRPDVVVNAARGLPFRTGSLSRVSCFDLVEHLEDIPALMREIHRILEPGGTVFLTTPHYSCANSYTDPTHKQHFGWRSFDYFTAEHALRYYSTARFRIARRVLRFHGGVVDAVVRRIAAVWPDFYEHRLAWIFPAWYLEFELQAVKNSVKSEA